MRRKRFGFPDKIGERYGKLRFRGGKVVNHDDVVQAVGGICQ